MQTEERSTIIVDMECPNCGGILITDADFNDFTEKPRFAPVPQCSHCFEPFDGGLVPHKKTAKEWLSIFLHCQWEFEHKDIIQCYMETVFMDVKKGGGSGNGKKSKPPMKFERHYFNGDF